MIDVASFTRLGPPHFHLWHGSASAFCNFVWASGHELPAGFAVRMLQGPRMSTEDGVFQEVAAEFQFPYYFGFNWDALDECIADLEWMPASGYLVGISEADKVLSVQSDIIPTFMRVLAGAAAFWASEANSQYREARERAPVPFHLILHAEERNAGQLASLLSTLETRKI